MTSGQDTLGAGAPKVGDYVLATKYSDGDPGDPWALGFYAGVEFVDRHMVRGRAARAGLDEQVRKDAARYRWLRAQHWNEARLCVVADPKKAVKLGYDCPSLDRLDAAIDAAMASTQEKKG